MYQRIMSWAGALLMLAACQSTDSGADKAASGRASRAARRPSVPAPVAPPAASVAAPDTAHFSGYRRYVGTVGAASVVLELTLGDSCTGHYYYQRHGLPLELQAVHFRPGQPLQLQEWADNQLTGTWHTTQPAGPELTGTWHSADGRRTQPFRLHEDYTGKLRYQVVRWNGTGAACNYYEDHTDTASYEAEYVRILGGGVPAAVRRRLRQALGPPVPENQMQAYVDGVAETDENSCATNSKSLTVTLNQDYLFALSTYADNYGFGAAHPNHQLGGLAYSLRTGRELALTDLLRPGYERPLRQLISQALLTDPEYAGITRNEGWRWDADTDLPEEEPRLAPLPDGGFILEPGGITFQYSDYEICAYGDGMPSVTLTYAQLRPLIRPDGPLAPLLARSLGGSRH